MRNFKIISNHTVSVDNYNEGEQENVNNYSLNATIKAENPRKAIELYFENELFYKFNFENSFIPHEEEDEAEENILIYDVLVDFDNEEASERRINSWKKGKETLYNNNIFITIFELNSVKI